MTANSESQCYFIQLQIDSYLDGELSQPQQEVFTAHVHDCQGCAAELHFARQLQDRLMDLPLLDCEQRVLAPLAQLEPEPHPSAGLWQGLGQWFASLAPLPRLALPAAAAVLLMLALLPLVNNSDAPPAQLAETSEAGYSPEEVAAALRDLNTAIDYLNEVSQRTEVMIGDRFLMTPLRESLNASFEQTLQDDDTALNNGPI